MSRTRGRARQENITKTGRDLRTTAQTTPAGYRQLLRAWGESDGALTARAAMHLLLFTTIPDAPGFARHIEADHVRTVAGLVHCAWVSDWNALVNDRELCRSENEARFLQIAASFAAGRPVSLFAAISVSLGAAWAQRPAEAVLIAAGAAELVTVKGPQPEAGIPAGTSAGHQGSAGA